MHKGYNNFRSIPIALFVRYDLFSECCIELTIMIVIKENRNSQFAGHYLFDIDQLTEDEIKSLKFLYSQNEGKHILYKTKDGVWAVSIQN